MKLTVMICGFRQQVLNYYIEACKMRSSQCDNDSKSKC